METLHAQPAPGTDGAYAVTCSCSGGITKTTTATVLESGHLRCPDRCCIVTFCPHCGGFTSSRQGDYTLIEIGDSRIWNCIACGKPKQGG